MLLTFIIHKQLICRTDKETPVANSENFLYAQFTFSEEWTGTKTAIFNNGTPYSIQLDADNKCLVPWEVITSPGFSVSAFCGERVTANNAYVNVLASGYVEGQTPQPPSKTVYDQILDEMDSKLEATNIKGGNNVTLDKDGNDITINAEGGGASVEVDNVTLENDGGTLKVKNGGINTAQIKNGAVNNGRLADSSVTSDKLNNYSVTEQKLSATLQTNIGKIPTLVQGLSDEVTARENADINLQGQIDAITVSSDVVDVVATYTDLQNYDTQHIKANDIVKVMQDSTHSNAISYYRWVITEGVGAWTYVGSEGPYYTKGEADALLQGKQDVLIAGANVQIENDVISATDTTYSAGTGIDITDNVISATGGGSSYSAGTGIDITNDTISVDFTDVQAKLTAGDGIAISNGTITAINPELIEFVTTKPSSNIDTDKYYMTLNARIFPDASSLVTEDKPQIIISKVGNDYVAVTSNRTSSAGFFHYGSGSPYSIAYIEYKVVNGTWTQIKTADNDEWANDLGITSATSLGDIKYCNHGLKWEFEGDVWNSSMNTATIEGITTDTSNVNPYRWIANKYVNGSWVEVGECNYEELFNKARPNNLVFDNITVATTDWVSDSTYSDLPYKAVITCQGVTSSMVADVYLDGASADLKVVADFCTEGTDSVTIYANDNTNAVTIKRIEVKQ